MSLSIKNALSRYESDILYLTRKCPAFWKPDIRQELRYTVIRLCQLTDPKGSLDDNLVKLTIIREFKRFCKLERNKGMKYAPDVVNWLDITEDIKQFHYNIVNNGDKVKIHNHL